MEINNIKYSYDNKKDQLDDITGKIEMGKVTTIIGPNGSGKSTLLGVLTNNYIPHTGEIRLEGKNINDFKAKDLAQKLGVVYQQNIAPNDMTVEKLTSYGRLPYRKILSSKNQEDDEAIEWALEKTNLQSKRHSTIDKLSGGELQRVWIAMTLAQKTPILFLDEPTTYLDIYHQYEILELINILNKEQNITIVMVLHDINQAIRYSDIIIAMKDGKIIQNGSPKNVITKQTMRDIYNVDVLITENEETGLYAIPIGI